MTPVVVAATLLPAVARAAVGIGLGATAGAGSLAQIDLAARTKAWAALVSSYKPGAEVQAGLWLDRAARKVEA